MSPIDVALPGRATPGRTLRRLSVPECLALLSRGSVGRLAFTQGPAPVILPVNYVLDGVTVVLRTAAGTQLAELPDGEGVALEADWVDADYHTGWSVLLRGRLDRVTQADELARCATLPLGVYAPGSRKEWRRITPATISGRRIGS